MQSALSEKLLTVHSVEKVANLISFKVHDIAILPHSLHGYTYKYDGLSSIDIGNGLDWTLLC